MSVKLKIKVDRAILARSAMCNWRKLSNGIFQQKTEADKDVEMIGENCAIALAVREIFPDATVGNAAIFPFGVRMIQITSSFGTMMGYDPELDWEKIVLPDSAQQFINRFDRSSPDSRLDMNELEFEIEIQDYVINKLPLSDISELIKDSRTLELV